jgi:hypothetical protein
MEGKNNLENIQAKEVRKRAVGAAKVVLKVLLLTGAIAIAASSPSLGRRWRGKFPKRNALQKSPQTKIARIPKRRIFQRKDSKRVLLFEKKGIDQCGIPGSANVVSLTEKGAKKAGKYKINDLAIKKVEKVGIKNGGY